ncbi:VCBS repeat-containing protein [Maribacter sp. R77961]|uniref:VCBS repeat-containing protein n=1 Tax=Maribacter sp. R77961 TaxID=3093871 RepID=UPI0037C968FC
MITHSNSFGLKSIPSYIKWCAFFLLSIVFSCQNSTTSDNNTLFTKLEPQQTNIDFENVVANTKDLNIFNYRNFYNGGGVAIGDINNDGLADMFFTANINKNKLYLNQGDFKFKDITKEAVIEGINNWSTGIVMVDINADGWLDIYVCNAGNVEGDNRKNELYINNKDLTFTESAADYNLADDGFTTQATFFDYDKDGDLDVYILNNSFIPVSSLGYSDKRDLRSEDWDIPDMLKGGGDKLLRNDNGRFVDVSDEAGIYGSLIGFGLGVSVGDINNDSWPDLYVSNDFFERDYLYINQKNGTFLEKIKDFTSHTSLSSMGSDIADINNDGFPEVFTTDMLPEDNIRLKETSEYENYDLLQLKRSKDFHNQYMQNALQLNNGNNSFSEIAFHSGVAMTDWSWGALLLDIDNDGYKDIFVSNGIYHDLTNQDFMDFFANDILQKMALSGKKESMNTVLDKMPSTPIKNYAFKNNKDLTFTNAAEAWGIDDESFSNGAAYGDLDNDGDLDLVINNVNQPAFVYRNESNKKKNNNYIQLKLKEENKNTYAIGSKVTVHMGNQVLTQELYPSRGFQSSVDYTLTFGVGDATKIDSLKIVWPNDNVQTLINPVLNTRLEISKPDDSSLLKTQPVANKNTLFTQLSQDFEAHKENNYVDFDFEGLLFQMLSKEGPITAICDVNKDGKKDFYVGGAKKQKGKLYLSKQDRFVVKETAAFAEDVLFEDTAATFFDANNDGNLDLLVGSGGNDTSSSKLGLRLYLNDGKGNFIKNPSLQIPFNNYNTAVLRANDFDNDGDVDVFVGNRSVVGAYGLTPKHYLLENDGKGSFKNVITEKAQDVAEIAMITDAQWVDVNNDKTKDLVVAEDWGGIHVFTNTSGHLENTSIHLNQLKGWWKSVKVLDVDNDGDMDFVLGNRGTNTSCIPDSTNTVKMFVNDFDFNGTIEQIVTKQEGGRDMPIHLKRDLTAQLAHLKKENLKFSDYSRKSINDLFSEKKLNQSIQKEVNTSLSVIAINNGNSHFTIKALPERAQLSCINDMDFVDVNNDGFLDIIYGGNNYALKPQFSQLDASFGGLLLNNGKGDFDWVSYTDSGIFVKGVVNSVNVIQDDKKDTKVLFGINNEKPVLFSLND